MMVTLSSSPSGSHRLREAARRGHDIQRQLAAAALGACGLQRRRRLPCLPLTGKGRKRMSWTARRAGRLGVRCVKRLRDCSAAAWRAQSCKQRANLCLPRAGRQAGQRYTKRSAA